MISNQAGAIGCFVLAALVAAVMHWRTRRRFKHEDQTEHWLKVPAVVRRSGTTPATAAGAGGGPLPHYGAVIHQPFVEYVYVVGGRTYIGNRIAIARLGGATKSEANKTLARYLPGARVPAYVNPDDHTDAVLERRDDRQRRWLVANGYAVAGLIASAGVIALLPR